jgi:hypothetical protein
MYDLLLTKLITEGYHWPSNFDKSCFFDLWEYVGVNTYGDIHLFSEAKSFLGVGEEPQNNVLSEYWLREYLR